MEPIKILEWNWSDSKKNINNQKSFHLYLKHLNQSSLWTDTATTGIILQYCVFGLDYGWMNERGEVRANHHWRVEEYAIVLPIFEEFATCHSSVSIQLLRPWAQWSLDQSVHLNRLDHNLIQLYANVLAEKLSDFINNLDSNEKNWKLKDCVTVA